MAGQKNNTLEDLREIMVRLRDPENGCPWDQQQSFSSIAPYTIEEAHEVADVIARQAWSELPDELGDLLFQVAFYARLAEEKGWFDFSDVLAAICDKMIRRHPHVFADQRYADLLEQTRAWERIKSAERGEVGQQGALDGISGGLPSFRLAEKLQRRASGVGFDWPHENSVLDKLREELAELEDAMGAVSASATVGASGDIEDELGDVLFTVVNLARHLKLDPDQALRKASAKFEARFRKMEALARGQGVTLGEMDSSAMEVLWQRVKRAAAGD